MQKSVLFLMTSLLLAGCTSTPKEAPVCSGNTLRGCQPVIYFDTGSSALDQKAKANLDWAYEKMVRFPRERVTISGYTDAVGNFESNFSLSERRASAVKDYLVAKGIESNRIDVAFHGEQDPVCSSSDCLNLNRRVELELYKPDTGGYIDMKKVSSKLEDVKCYLCDEED